MEKIRLANIKRLTDMIRADIGRTISYGVAWQIARELIDKGVVVEVVRCKDCKWCLIENWDGEILYGCDCAAGMNDVSPDDFCSCGARRKK